MKKFAVISFLLIICSIGAIAAQYQPPKADYIRIHIRANSNDDIDQNVKYKVKESIVEMLSPRLSGAQSKAQAFAIVNANLSEIEKTANATLSANGFDYTSHAKLCQEKFPTRSYGELTLSSGVYDALILELGSGTGDNWWCVVFPPLCFVADGEGEKVVYKSKIVELWNEFVQD
ncbi:MAG: stage II sporulation protein R [Clostridia bacterium]